ncbi:VTT domain-containing protein [Rhodovastum sp. RN2-1]|uniref:TVP38/TMEM64 family membrane protein n=1 Tax=Limobrevibacterium gyesilva TaxID=2991712 RepID=A0AA41YLF1_9PROT|nr:VTT domain-containing protein [Limobrevibacterium gyesilva]MCW3474825.1 VTT domain-containing protein [Limobrevibacterium gyesilva]
MRRFWPLLPVLLVVAGAYALGLQHELNWATLAARHAMLRALVAAHPLAACLAFVATYATAVAVSFPGAVVLTVAGGLLFGTALGALLTVTGATTGSVLIFLAARTALAPLLAARAGPFLDRFRSGLQRDAFSYILAMRLIPVIPFWLVNLAPALLGVRLAPFAAATCIGIIPATTVFASLGAGIGDVLAAGGRPDLTVILSPPVLLPLLGLATLSLLPVAWRRWKGQNV